MPSLLQMMACCLFSAKPLSEPMLPDCQLDPKHAKEGFSEILFKIQKVSFMTMHLKMLSLKWWPFCLGLNVLSNLGL